MESIKSNTMETINPNTNQSLEQLKLNITSFCEMYDELDSPLQMSKFNQISNDINSMVELLSNLKSKLVNSQFDFECSGYNSVQIEINYDYDFSEVEGDYVVYNYSHSSDSGTVQISKVDIIEHLINGGDINELITEEIDSSINYQYS
jgi:hypothetical protein